MAGKRHSAGDMALLAELATLVSKAHELCEKLGYESEDEAEEEDQGEGNGNETSPDFDSTEKKSADMPADIQEDQTTKAISLDEKVSNVREAFSRFCSKHGMTNYEDGCYCWCTAVYDDYLICKMGMVNYKVSFTWSGDKIEFPERDQWQKVETEWVVKNAPLWMIQQAEPQSVKALGGNRLGMYLVMYGDKNSADLSGEYFTSKTEGMLDVFKAMGKIPLLYHHGADDTMKTTVLGHYDVMVEDEVGIWAEAQLTAANQYVQVVKEMAKRGYLGSSSGTLPGPRKVNKSTGEIEKWTIVEGSLTPTPMDWRQRTESPVQVLKSYFSELGLSLAVPGEESSTEGDEESRKSLELELEREKLALLELEAALI